MVSAHSLIVAHDHVINAMSLGVSRPIPPVIQNDTADLVAYLRINEIPITEDQIVSVSFIVQKPDGTSTTSLGTVQTDGSGFLRWSNTTLIGEYIAQAQFNLVSGEIRSVMVPFTVYDPFNPPTPTQTDLIVDAVQLRLEDCFDSVEGGPWLRDRSLAHFDYTKVADFIPEALLDINVQMPPTNYDLGTFASWSTTPGDNPNMPLLVKGVLLLTIRHLMRSYTEQPMPAGGQVVWHDRTRYQQMWNQIYQVELKDWTEKVRLFKRTELALGHAASLTFSKAGRLYPYGNMRTRGISRGYY